MQDRKVKRETGEILFLWILESRNKSMPSRLSQFSEFIEQQEKSKASDFERKMNSKSNLSHWKWIPVENSLNFFCSKTISLLAFFFRCRMNL